MLPDPDLRWVLLLLLPTLSHQDAPGLFSVEVQSPVSGLLGSSVSLPCALDKPLDARPMEVHWYRPKMADTTVLLYENGTIQKSRVDVRYQGRVFLSGDLEKGDVSLDLANLMLADRGEYVCHVSSESWYDEAHMTLTVRAVGSTPDLSVHEAGEGKMKVSCQSHGWLPEPAIIWTDGDGGDLKHLSNDNFTNDSDGFVDVSSWLVVSRSESEWISCSVGFSDQERKAGRIIPHLPSVDAGSVPGYVIGILVAVLLLLLLCAAGTAVYCIHKKGLIQSWSKAGGDTDEENPSELEPLNKNPLKNPDQNEDVLVESGGRHQESRSHSSGFATACSETDLDVKPKSKIADLISFFSPSAISKNPKLADTVSDASSMAPNSKPTPTTTISGLKPPATIPKPTASSTDPKHAGISDASSIAPNSEPTPAAKISCAKLPATMLKPTVSSTDTKHADISDASSIAHDSEPTPVTTISDSKPSATMPKPTVSRTDPKHADISDASSIAPNSEPTPGTTISDSKPSATMPKPTVSSTDPKHADISDASSIAPNSEPTPAAKISRPKPPATMPKPTVSSTDPKHADISDASSIAHDSEADCHQHRSQTC